MTRDTTEVTYKEADQLVVEEEALKLQVTELEETLSQFLDDIDDITNADNPSVHSVLNNLRYLVKSIRTQHLV